MFENDYSPSSSLLPMTDRTKQLWPKTKNEKRISVAVDTLDNVTRRLGVKGPAFLKLDVQGFELRVLNGATTTLRDTEIAMMGVQFDNLYEGQANLKH